VFVANEPRKISKLEVADLRGFSENEVGDPGEFSLPILRGMDLS
jgi:hypothetical protein